MKIYNRLALFSMSIIALGLIVNLFIHDYNYNFHHIAYETAHLEDKEKTLIWLVLGNTELDGVAASMGAAYLYGNQAQRQGNLSPAALWALQKFKGKALPIFDNNQVANLGLIVSGELVRDITPYQSHKIVALIGHNPPPSWTGKITDTLRVDLRAWGSSSAIIAEKIVLAGKEPSPTITGMLFAGILWQTQGLSASTTTRKDKELAKYLGNILQINDITVFYEQMQDELQRQH
jgi:inorganic pyrophosphatase/exopolyphosphatase